MNVEVAKRTTVLDVTMTDHGLVFAGTVSIDTEGKKEVEGTISSPAGASYGTICRAIGPNQLADNSQLNGAPVIALAFCNQIFQAAEAMLAMFPDRNPLPTVPDAPEATAIPGHEQEAPDWDGNDAQTETVIPAARKAKK